MWNYSLNEKTERGGGYGQSEVELRYALRVKHNLVMLKIATYEESLWSIVISMFLWSPLIWFLFLLPAYMFLFVFLSDALAISRSDSNVYELLLAYGSALYLSLRKQSPLRDYRARKQYIGTKTMTLHFGQQSLVAEEVYRYAPGKNQVQTIAFDKIHVFTVWQEGNRTNNDDDTYLDSVSVFLRFKSGGFKQMSWAKRKIEEYIFTHEYDGTDAAQATEAKEKVAEIVALLKTQNLHQST